MNHSQYTLDETPQPLIDIPARPKREIVEEMKILGPT